MPKWFGLAPLIVLLAACSRTVPCTDSSQTASAAASQALENEGARSEQQGPAPGVKPTEPKALRPPRVSHVEREPVMTGVPREPIGEADRMMPPPREPIGEADRMMPGMDLEIPGGMDVQVRLSQGLDTRTSHGGDSFSATLTRPVLVNGISVLPVDTPFIGHVINSSNSGRFKSRAVLAVKLDSFRLRGQEYRIDTSSVTRESTAQKKNFLLTGGGAAIGALTGGRNGEERAVAGEGVDTGTGKLYVVIAPETVLTFKLKHPVEM